MTRGKRVSPSAGGSAFNYEDLLALLRHELQIVESLIELALQQREAIVDRQRDQIEALATEKGRLLDQWSALEAQRQAAVVNWARHNAGGAPLSNPPPTLSDMLKSISEQKEGKKLREVADTLSERLAKLDEINKDNAGLLYYSLAVVQTMLGALTGNEARGTIYGPGKTSPPPDQGGKAVLDWRA